MTYIRSVWNAPKRAYSWVKSRPKTIGAVALAADQAIKYAAQLSFAPGGTRSITENIAVGYVKNINGLHGVDHRFAFLKSLISSNHFEALTSGLALVGCSYLWRKTDSPAGKIALSLASAGILGNLIDRITSSGVTDIINIGFINQYYFNGADSYPFLAGLVLAASLIINKAASAIHKSGL